MVLKVSLATHYKILITVSFTLITLSLPLNILYSFNKVYWKSQWLNRSEMTRNVHLVEHNKALGGGRVVVRVVQLYSAHLKGEKVKKRKKRGENDIMYRK